MIPRARKEALEWDDRLKRDRSRDTRVAFEAWLVADPANRAEYAQIGALDALMADARLKSVRPSLPTRRRLWPALATAATVGVVAVVLLVGSPFSNQAGGPAWISSAEAKLTRPVRLADGTLVILSAKGVAEPHFTSARRQVTLRAGSARFIVARDPARPFIVETARARATAVEGVFDMDTAGAASRVTTLSGTVTVLAITEAPPTSRAVGAGQSLDTATSMLSPAPRHERVTVIEADGMALSDVIAIANAAAGVPLAVAAPAVGERRVTGRFDVSDHRMLARRLAAALQLRIVEADGRLLLAPP